MTVHCCVQEPPGPTEHAPDVANRITPMLGLTETMEYVPGSVLKVQGATAMVSRFNVATTYGPNGFVKSCGLPLKGEVTTWLVMAADTSAPTTGVLTVSPTVDPNVTEIGKVTVQGREDTTDRVSTTPGKGPTGGNVSWVVTSNSPAQAQQEITSSQSIKVLCQQHFSRQDPLHTLEDGQGAVQTRNSLHTALRQECGPIQTKHKLVDATALRCSPCRRACRG